MISAFLLILRITWVCPSKHIWYRPNTGELFKMNFSKICTLEFGTVVLGKELFQLQFFVILLF